MKTIVVFLGVLAFASAYNWANVSPLNIDRTLPRRLIPRFPNSRIVNGEEVAPHSVPYQVALFIEMKDQDGTAFCGGSLIAKNYVLTAAHCVEPAKAITVVLGAHKIREEEDTQIKITNTSFKHHEHWSRFTLQNDIALVKLEEEVELNDNIQLVKLPTKSDNIDDVSAFVSGWGKDSDEATAVSEVLRGINRPIMSNENCNKIYMGIIQDTHVCTDSWEGEIGNGQSTCSGDSGGPLVLKETGEQVGIVSFGVALGCELGFPAAYTRLAEYLDWIKENTDGAAGY